MGDYVISKCAVCVIATAFLSPIIRQDKQPKTSSASAMSLVIAALVFAFVIVTRQPAIQERIDRGELKDCDVELAAGQFFDLCVAGVLRRMLLNAGPKPSEEEIETNVAAAVKVFLAAYAA